MLGFQILVFDDLLEDLEKSHVKAHFKKDASGKLIFIKDYDNSKHAHLLHKIFEKGHKVEINNSNSKHHGKTGTVSSYSDKYDVIRLKLDGGGDADFAPHQIEHKRLTLASQAATPPPAVSAPAPASAPVAVVSSPKLGLNDIVHELRLMGGSFSLPDMQHEFQRVDTMTPAQLQARIPKIQSDQKLYNFYRALSHRLKNTIASAVLKELEKRAIAKRASVLATPAVTTSQAPAAASPVPSTGQSIAPAKTGPLTGADYAKGDRVELLDGKHKGRQGIVSSYSSKYDCVRVKLDDGTYTDFHPSKGKNLTSIKVQPVIDPNATRGKDKTKRKERDDKGKKRVLDDDGNAVQPSTNPADYFRDKDKAYEVAPQEYKDLTHSLGVMPLDDQAYKYMQENMVLLQKQAKWVSTGGGGGYTIPAWAKDAARDSQQDYFYGSLIKHLSNPESNAVDLRFKNRAKTLMDKTKLKAAGYDIDRFFKIEKELTDLSKIHLESMKVDIGIEEFNKLLESFAGRNYDRRHSFLNKGQAVMLQKKFTPDTKITDILSDKDYRPDGSSSEIASKVLETLILTATNKNSMDGITMKDLVNGLEAASSNISKFSKNFTDQMKNNEAIKKINDSRIGAGSQALGFDNMIAYGLRDFQRHATDILNGSTPFMSECFKANIAYDYSLLKPFKKAIDSYPEIKHNIAANLVLQDGHYRKTGDSDFIGIILSPDLVRSRESAIENGTKIARRKGEYHTIAEQLVIDYNKSKGKTLLGAARNVKAVLKTVDDKTLEKVKKKFEQSWDKVAHGHFNYNIKGVYQIGGMDMFDEFKKLETAKGNVKFMYHGTDFGAASNIIKTGFAAPAKSKAGKMLGPGVYVTPVSSKSAQYLHDGGFTRQKGTRGVMFVNKCVMGNNFNCGSSHSNWTNAPAGTDSVGVLKGQAGIANEEHCIKNPKGVLPTFWIDVELK